MKCSLWFVALARALASVYEKQTGKAAVSGSEEWKQWLEETIFSSEGEDMRKPKRPAELTHHPKGMCSYLGEWISCSGRGCDRLATWLQKGGRYQRYWCDECVTRTKASIDSPSDTE